MMTVEQVARRIKRSKNHTYVLLREPDAPPPRDMDGRRKLFALEDIIAWRESRRWYSARCERRK